MAQKIAVQLRERGEPTIVDLASWRNICAITNVDDLVRIGAVGVSVVGTGVLLSPRSIVGAYTSPLFSLRISPKSKAMYASLLAFINEWRKLVSVQDEERRGDIELEADVWITLCKLLEALLRQGQPWNYSTPVAVSSMPRGKILFRETATRLLSRGITHKIYHRTQRRNYYEDLATALDTVCRFLEDSNPSASGARTRAKKLIASTGDLSYPMSQSQAYEFFTTLEREDHSAASNQLARFCCEVLGPDEIFRLSAMIGKGVAEFIDMERVWEVAVQLLFERHLPTAQYSVELHALRGTNTRLFVDGGPKIDPDIIVFEKGAARIIVDAKYSESSSPSAGDVYQLASYMGCLQSHVGVLAYLGNADRTSIEKIGSLENGSTLYAAYVSPQEFSSSGSHESEIFVFLNELQMSPDRSGYAFG